MKTLGRIVRAVGIAALIVVVGGTLTILLGGVIFGGAGIVG